MGVDNDKAKYKSKANPIDKDLTVPLNWSSKLVLSVTTIILSKILLLSSFDLYREVRRWDNHPIEYDLPDPVVCWIR